MYNRYIPQADGTFRRSRMPDNCPEPSRQEPPRPEPPKEVCPPPEPEICPSPEPPKEQQRRDESRQKQPNSRQRNQRPNPTPPPRQNFRPPRQEHRPERNEGSVGSFLRQLLPKDFDTSDLLIVLLLLLMSGDCAEDQNSALLTLALYLFM